MPDRLLVPIMGGPAMTEDPRLVENDRGPALGHCQYCGAMLCRGGRVIFALESRRHEDVCDEARLRMEARDGR